MTIGRGMAAGFVGAAVMTAFQKLVEMPITGRGDSYAPADFAARLGVTSTNPRDRRRINYATHFALGAGWGAARGAADRAGLRGHAAAAVVYGVMWPGDVILVTALGLERPWRWSPRDWAIDAVDKLVLAEAIGLAYARLG